MSRDRHERLRSLFLAACELEPPARTTFLKLACGDDESLHAEVEALLREDAAPADSLAQPPMGTVDRLLRERFGEGEFHVSLHQDSSKTTADAETASDDDALSVDSGKSHYVRQRELARGGMGIIFKVWDREINRPLAMKVMVGTADAPAEVPDDSGILLRFLEEAQITGQLDHPGVVPVHRLGLDEENRLFFTMRLVRGQTLDCVFDLARSGRAGWTPTRVLGVFVKVCETLAYAHSKGVIHRDIKPRNVMVGSFGETYVMDWGVAKIVGRQDLHDLRLCEAGDDGPAIRTHRKEGDRTRGHSPLVTVDGAIVGTPAYMPPEQAEGRIDEIDARSDVYAVGAMLYELLAGHMPYVKPGTTSSPRAVLRSVVDGPPESLAHVRPGVPQELVAICDKAMARQRSDRYASCLEMREDLQAYLDGRVVRAYRTGALAEFRAWVARNRRSAAAGAVALILLVVGLLLFLVERNAAQSRLAEVLRLADIKRLGDFEEQAEFLWPCVPEKIPEMEDWLARAESLARRLPVHRQSLGALRSRAARDGVTASGEPNWRFVDAEDQWQHDTLAELVTGVERLLESDPRKGLIASVTRRLELARSARKRSIEDHREAWDRAIRSIADPGSCPAYGGLRIAPQIGLVPIGRNPESGLWEFAHLETGVPPVREESGRLVLAGESGLVLVLVPGGTFRMGAERSSSERPEGSPNVDRHALSNEQPVHEVTLDPFFISKYEMTQEQWERATGSNPSGFASEADLSGVLHPVENLSWEMCTRTLRQLGLLLPTEAQWEYATRGGTSTVWWTGDARESLEGKVNLADRSAARKGVQWADIQDWPELDDGYVVHAPVGTYAANPFGLHEVHGNVWEWCRDWHGSYTLPVSPGDGERQVPEMERVSRVLRGGGFIYAARKARSAIRQTGPPDFRSNDTGVRPARRLEVE